ncbi:MAG: sensor histidine kinase [Dinghuibacter sp.]|nr:sensor histidine kinase [Dinghuibacter sp.]
MFLVLGFMVRLVILFKRGRKQHHIEKQLMQVEYQQELLRTQLEIQEQTFNNISQEIHDNIGQVLSLVKLNLNTLTSPQAQKLEDTRLQLGKAITDLRDLSRSLHGEKIAETGLAAAIENEMKLLHNNGRFKTHFSLQGNAIPISAQADTFLFRIFQEAAQNAIKHSGGTIIEVMLNYTGNMLQLMIADNGKGYNPETIHSMQTGIGLKNMHTRARLIGATLHITTQPGMGTTLNISLPITE